MNVLLVNPPLQVRPLDLVIDFPPVALMDLAALIPEQHVEILDLRVKPLSYSKLKRKMSKSEIVGVSALTPSFKSALKICKIAKLQNVTTVLGGPHPTLVPSIVSHPEVDILVRGEGEITFKEIVEGKDLSQIKGISYCKGEEVLHNPDRPLIENLDSLPLPRKDLTKANSYHAFGVGLDAVDTYRGCPFSCDFCCTPVIWGHKSRGKSAERVIEEIKLVDKHKEIIFFADDNFCVDMERVDRICDLILSRRLDTDTAFRRGLIALSHIQIS
jgi:radical SAM superfamily enzyme YgiQ (UPF0313 family)